MPIQEHFVSVPKVISSIANAKTIKFNCTYGEEIEKKTIKREFPITSNSKCLCCMSYETGFLMEGAPFPFPFNACLSK